MSGYSNLHFFFLAGIFSFFSLFYAPPAFSLHFSFRAKKEKNSFFTHPHKNPLPRGARAGAIWQFFFVFFCKIAWGRGVGVGRGGKEVERDWGDGNAERKIEKNEYTNLFGLQAGSSIADFF